MTRRYRAGTILRTITIAAGILALPGALLAQTAPPPGPPPAGARAMRPGAAGPLRALMLPFRGLQLTADQRQQMRGIIQNHRADVRALAEKTRQARQDRRAAMLAQPVDQAAIQTANLRIATVETERIQLMDAIRGEMAQTLTPEQKQRYEARLARQRDVMKRRPGRKGGQ